MHRHALGLPGKSLCSFLYETATIQARSVFHVTHHGRVFSRLSLHAQDATRSRINREQARTPKQKSHRERDPRTKQSESLKDDGNPLVKTKFLSPGERKAFEELLGRSVSSNSEVMQSMKPVSGDPYDTNPARVVALFYNAPKQSRTQEEDLELQGPAYDNAFRYITALSQFYLNRIEGTKGSAEHALWHAFQELVLPLCLCTDQGYVKKEYLQLDRKKLMLAHLDLNAASALSEEETAAYDPLTRGDSIPQSDGWRRLVMTPKLRGLLEDLNPKYKLTQLRTTLFPAAVLLTLRMFAVHSPGSAYLSAVLHIIRQQLDAMGIANIKNEALESDADSEKTKPQKSVQEEVVDHTDLYNVLLAVEKDVYGDMTSLTALLSDMYARNIRANDETLWILKEVVEQDEATATKRRELGLEDWWTRPSQLSSTSRVLKWLRDMEGSRARIAAQRKTSVVT